jgi:hypothetical protein
MTNQEAFTTVVLHLRKQGRPARKGTDCRYRAPDGCKCAIGALIPDDQYDFELEGSNVFAITHLPALQYLNPGMLYDLQNLHDLYDPKEWESRFEYLAGKYKLEVPA